MTCDPDRLAALPANFSLSKRSLQGQSGLRDMLARWAWGVLGWFIPGGRAGGQPSAPHPHFPHHASLGWSWSQMVGMGQPCSFWPDKGSSILHPRPDQLGESSLWLPSHSQPWPALPGVAFLPKRSLPPCYLLRKFPKQCSWRALNLETHLAST